MNTLELLDRLIAFPTVSRDPNRALIDFVRQFLAERGVASELFEADGGRKANLFATIGPGDRPGVVLSGHTDVVPTDGQAWSTDPFRMTLSGGRAYGRGTADMKGFLASSLAFADRASRERLTTPVHLAFSHDEEVGCLGVRAMIGALGARAFKARLAIVGEPTSMRVAIGHKGKIAARATCCGLAGHSALAPRALNAIHLACDFVHALRGHQDRIAREGVRDDGYDIPHTTLHVGHIDGGTALNIVPDRCTIDFEIRAVAPDTPDGVLERLMDEADDIAASRRDLFPDARIGIDVVNQYPGLDTPEEAEVVRFVCGLVDAVGLSKVAFGTEGGFYAERLGIPAVVCGPGAMDQGHKPDEWIALEQLDACDRMLDRLLLQCR